MTSEHRWALAAVSVLTAEQASTVATMDLLEREEHLAELLRAGRLEAIRGPICTECRVHWRDVHAQPDKPWPCPGKRPKELGGPLAPPVGRKSRQERRAEQRAAVKSVARATPISSRSPRAGTR